MRWMCPCCPAAPCNTGHIIQPQQTSIAQVCHHCVINEAGIQCRAPLSCCHQHRPPSLPQLPSLPRQIRQSCQAVKSFKPERAVFHSKVQLMQVYLTPIASLHQGIQQALKNWPGQSHLQLVTPVGAPATSATQAVRGGARPGEPTSCRYTAHG